MRDMERTLDKVILGGGFRIGAVSVIFVVYMTYFAITDNGGPHGQVKRTLNAEKGRIFQAIKDDRPGTDLSQLTRRTPWSYTCQEHERTPANRHNMADNRTGERAYLFTCRFYTTPDGFKIQGVYFTSVTPDPSKNPLSVFEQPRWPVTLAWLKKESIRIEPVSGQLSVYQADEEDR